jgi:hypothetical protein
MAHLIDVMAANYFATIVGACVLAGMTLKSLTAIFTGLSRERSRREIAAYIAEGSMSPDQGERLLRADVNNGLRNRAA